MNEGRPRPHTHPQPGRELPAHSAAALTPHDRAGVFYLQHALREAHMTRCTESPGYRHCRRWVKLEAFTCMTDLANENATELRELSVQYAADDFKRKAR